MISKDWFQIRLSTAFILMLVAAGLLYLNLRVESSISERPPTSVTRYFEQTSRCGYPLTVYRETVSWSESMVRASRDNKRSDPVVTLRWGSAALDLLFAVVLLGTAAIGIEFLIREWRALAALGWRRAPAVGAASLMLVVVWLMNLLPSHVTLPESGLSVSTYGWPYTTDVDVDETDPGNAAFIDKVRDHKPDEWYSPGMIRMSVEIMSLTPSDHRPCNRAVAGVLCFLALGACEVALWRRRRPDSFKVAAA